MPRAVVAIISHKPSLTSLEEIAIRQCVRILGNHPITLICPKGLDTAVYKRLAPMATIDLVDPKWLSTYAMFNAFKMSPVLYEMYREYEFILFYEPDAFVFADELEFWCDQGFDYIGAPWGEVGSNGIETFTGVGNGGFSLRKTESHLEIARLVESERLLLRGYRWHLKYKGGFLKQWVSNLAKKSHEPNYYMAPAYGNEDIHWAVQVPIHFPTFKVASVAEAVPFSFERHPRILYRLNSERLPFGCHAWFKHDFPFWKPFIRTYGYEL